jgi:hypothetical protein
MRAGMTGIGDFKNVVQQPVSETGVFA